MFFLKKLKFFNKNCSKNDKLKNIFENILLRIEENKKIKFINKFNENKIQKIFFVRNKSNILVLAVLKKRIYKLVSILLDFKIFKSFYKKQSIKIESISSIIEFILKKIIHIKKIKSFFFNVLKIIKSPFNTIKSIKFVLQI